MILKHQNNSGRALEFNRALRFSSKRNHFPGNCVIPRNNLASSGTGLGSEMDELYIEIIYFQYI